MLQKSSTFPLLSSFADPLEELHAIVEGKQREKAAECAKGQHQVGAERVLAEEVAEQANVGAHSEGG